MYNKKMCAQESEIDGIVGQLLALKLHNSAIHTPAQVYLLRCSFSEDLELGSVTNYGRVQKQRFEPKIDLIKEKLYYVLQDFYVTFWLLLKVIQKGFFF